MSDAGMVQKRKRTGLAWIAGGVALFIAASTLTARLVDVNSPSVAVLVALAMTFFVALRAPARLRAFQLSREQAKHGFEWLGFCLGVAVAWPLTTWLLAGVFDRLGL